MTDLQQKALDYFDEASKRSHRDPDLKRALDIVSMTYRQWTSRGWENCITGASFAAMRWLHSWDAGGRVGGLRRFSFGLKNAMRWAALRVKPNSHQIVQGFESDGTPHFDKTRGPCPPIPVSEAASLVKLWNEESRQEGSNYRFRLTTHRRATKASGFRLIYRYELERFEKVQMVSLDAGQDEFGEGVGQWDDGTKAGWLE